MKDLRPDPTLHLKLERGDVDVVSGLPQQVLVMGHHHVAVLRQVTVQLQHLRAALHCTSQYSDSYIIEMSSRLVQFPPSFLLLIFVSVTNQLRW